MSLPFKEQFQRKYITSFVLLTVFKRYNQWDFQTFGQVGLTTGLILKGVLEFANITPPINEFIYDKIYMLEIYNSLWEIGLKSKCWNLI